MNFDQIMDEYRKAKAAYDAAERAFAAASATLHHAERARNDGWNKLVAAADKVPDYARKKLAEEQYGKQTS